jgi:hypothetical protein
MKRKISFKFEMTKIGFGGFYEVMFLKPQNEGPQKIWGLGV